MPPELCYLLLCSIKGPVCDSINSAGVCLGAHRTHRCARTSRRNMNGCAQAYLAVLLYLDMPL